LYYCKTPGLRRSDSYQIYIKMNPFVLKAFFRIIPLNLMTEKSRSSFDLHFALFLASSRSETARLFRKLLYHLSSGIFIFSLGAVNIKHNNF